MGMDIVLMRYQGVGPEGYSVWEHVNHPKWPEFRYAARKHLLDLDNKLEWHWEGDDGWHDEGGCRPADFDKAREWVEEFEDEFTREFLGNVFDILEESDDLYIQFWF